MTVVAVRQHLLMGLIFEPALLQSFSRMMWIMENYVFNRKNHRASINALPPSLRSFVSAVTSARFRSFAIA